MNKLGELLGWLTVIFYSASVASFFLKAIYKRFSSVIKNDLHINRPYTALMKFAIRYHRLFGGLAIACLATHFYIQWTTRGFNSSGALAAIVLIAQVTLGIIGAYVVKKRHGLWFVMHRTIAVILFVAIVRHIL
jgi:heme A synthase